jgi:hypothetical protein
MQAYFDFFERRPDAFGLLFASGRSDPAVVMAERVLDAITDRLADMVATVLARAGRPPSPHTRLLAAMLLGIAHHGVAALRSDPTLDPRALLLSMHPGTAAAMPRTSGALLLSLSSANVADFSVGDPLGTRRGRPRRRRGRARRSVKERACFAQPIRAGHDRQRSGDALGRPRLRTLAGRPAT